MVDSSSENNTLKRVIADEAYDNNETFQYLSDKGIEAAIKVRKEKLFIWQQINRLSKKDSYCTEAVKEFECQVDGRLKLVMDPGGWPKQYSRY
jgi:hypothetical protein